MIPAVVARVDLRGVVVLDGKGVRHPAAVRKRLMDPGARLGNAVVPGDHVELEHGPDGGAVVAAVAPRRNRFERAAAGHAARGRTQILAANLDQVLAVAALRNPPLREGLLDRFAVTCEWLSLPLVVALTKADLATPEETEGARAAYARAGYPTLVLAARQGKGLDALRDVLHGKRTLILGHSGVGKSTLLNALVPGLDLRTGEVNERTGRGRHTTTAASLVRLDDAGTEVIDTPGVRAFGLPPALDAALLPKLFPEWRGRGDCRFSDCTHREEPGCVLRAAVEEGAIAAERYASYVRLAEELAGRPARRARAKAPRR